MIRIVKKASSKITDGLSEVKKKVAIQEQQSIGCYKLECGLNAFICGNGKMKKIS